MSLTRADALDAMAERRWLSGATGIIDLGHPNGWRAAAYFYDGIKFRIGCHTKTLAAAREYWAGKPDRREIMAAIDYAVAVAKLRGWRIDE